MTTHYGSQQIASVQHRLVATTLGSFSESGSGDSIQDMAFLDNSKSQQLTIRTGVEKREMITRASDNMQGRGVQSRAYLNK